MNIRTLFVYGFLVLFLALTSNATAAEENFDSDKIMTELEKKLELSQEKISELKPQIDAKSSELKKSIQDSVDKGFLHLEKMNRQLDAASKEAEEKIQEFLSSEEYAKFKEYLSKIDKEAIEETKEQLVDEMSEVLRLSKEQLAEIKPILEDGINQLNDLAAELMKKGSSSWDEFKMQYEELTKELQNSLKNMLDPEQLERLDKYNKDKKEKIHDKVIAI